MHFDITAETVVWAAGVLSALIVICGVLVKLAKVVSALAKDREFAKFCRLWTLRQAIVNDEFPLSERIEAGKQYVSHGGNGYVKHYLETLDEAQAETARSEAGETL